MTLVENVHIVQERDACVVTLSGEIEEIAAPAVLAEVLAAVAAGPAGMKDVVIDVSAVTFLDSSGIGTLVAIRSAALKRGAQVSLRRVTPRIAQLLRITALDELFGISG